MRIAMGQIWRHSHDQSLVTITGVAWEGDPYTTEGSFYKRVLLAHYTCVEEGEMTVEGWCINREPEDVRWGYPVPASWDIHSEMCGAKRCTDCVLSGVCNYNIRHEDDFKKRLAELKMLLPKVILEDGRYVLKE